MGEISGHCINVGMLNLSYWKYYLEHGLQNRTERASSLSSAAQPEDMRQKFFGATTSAWRKLDFLLATALKVQHILALEYIKFSIN